ncbi:hypothetical protein [Geomonas sp.]|uniref:hypothetical protein n=1 Tax=Geomonas sp. TaxID=2651584 RepID=UPI002B465C90|nr:hypothetical protein [Geomonas sp.]HJV35972.1 hypothetical protein [Geomonas sp.]
MSSILKALEKVEQSQNTRRTGGPSSLPKARQRRPAWVLPVGVIGGAAVASLLTFAAMGGFSKPGVTTARPQPVPAVPKEVAAVQPAPLAAAPQPKHTPAVTQKAPAAVASPKPVSAPAVKAAAATTSPAAVKHPPVAKATSAAVAKSEQKRAKVATPVKSAPAAKVVAKKSQHPQSVASKKVTAVHSVATQPAPVREAAPLAPPAQVAQAKSRPEVRVTGIAWQNDSQSSAAIVNGHMVSQGATVDGYRIEQIFEDKVRFSGKSGTVDVPLSAGE